jgi:hypothetical protein
MTISSWLGLHRSILDGSLMQEPPATRWLWVVMLLVADKSGYVRYTTERLAQRASITLQETEAGLKCFESSDPGSRSAEYGGRRIKKVDGGWFIFNYQVHLEGLASQEAREGWAAIAVSNGFSYPEPPPSPCT